MASLRNQIYDYSKGHVAYQLTTLLQDGDRRALVRLVYSLPKAYLRRAWHRLRGCTDYPLSLILLEIRGNLAGAFALWRARRRVRCLGASLPLGPRPTPVLKTAAPPLPEHPPAVSLERPLTRDPAA